MRSTIKTKLGVAFGTVILLATITAWLGVSNLSSLDTRMEEVLAGPIARVDLAQDMERGLLSAIRAEKNLLLAGNNTDERARFDAELVKQREAFSVLLEKLDGMATEE